MVNRVVAILQIKGQHTRYSIWGIIGLLFSKMLKGMLEVVILVNRWDGQSSLMKCHSIPKSSLDRLKSGPLTSLVQFIHHHKGRSTFWSIQTMLLSG